jgi:hypothetical protein
LKQMSIYKTGFLCENLCEKNFPNSDKFDKNRKKCGKSIATILVVYNKLRGIGNSKSLSTNP